ncbi:MAG: PGF-CTERM sorting domain-containing protein [Candidatus Thalassarchaeaceae archaeon]|jgi:hypothetical protein|nr:PGF-CTERM sorting domain-containing protein [Candidatus Thalassarchaeaceae archaeon]
MPKNGLKKTDWDIFIIVILSVKQLKCYDGTYYYVNGEFWLRCNSDDPIIDGGGGEPTDPPVGGGDGDSDGGGSTSPLPGFTGIMAMVAMLSAVIIRKRRDYS